jgi:hypothetical protein
MQPQWLGEAADGEDRIEARHRANVQRLANTQPAMASARQHGLMTKERDQ